MVTAESVFPSIPVTSSGGFDCSPRNRRLTDLTATVNRARPVSRIEAHSRVRTPPAFSVPPVHNRSPRMKLMLWNYRELTPRYPVPHRQEAGGFEAGREGR